MRTRIKTFFRQQFSLSTAKMQQLIEVLSCYMNNEIRAGNFQAYASSPITVVNGIIQVDFELRLDLPAALRTLREYQPFATYPEAFSALFGWAVLAPLHDELKRRSIKGVQTPLVMLPGKTKAGKTSLAGNLFIGKGFDLPAQKYFYEHERVATRFAFMRHMGETNLPALLDDMLPDWIFKQKEALKAYVQTGHFGDRGRGDQTLQEYRGRRSFVLTINDDVRIDNDLALSMRLLIFRFTEFHRSRADKAKFDATFDALPDVFMFEIFRQIFEGKMINEILKEVEKFEIVADWANYGIDRINELCDKYGIEKFPAYEQTKEINGFTNAFEIAQAFLEEWERMQIGEEHMNRETDTVEKYMKYRSQVEGALKVERKEGRILIHFTSSAFKTLTARLALKVPFSNALNFINNIYSDPDDVQVEYSGKAHGVWFLNGSLKAYTISIKEEQL